MKSQTQKCWEVPACSWFPALCVVHPNKSFCWWNLRFLAICRGNRSQKLSSLFPLHQLEGPVFPDHSTSFICLLTLMLQKSWVWLFFDFLQPPFFFFLNPCFPSVLDYVRSYSYYRVSLVAQMVKNLSAMQATQVWSLGWEDPLEKEMVTHSSILAWRISWTEEPGGLQSMRLQRVRPN